MKTKLLLLALSGILGLTQLAYAETNFGKQTPTADDVIKALNPDAANPDSDYEGDVNKDSTSRMIKMDELGGQPKAAKTKTGKPKKTIAKHEKAQQVETAALSMEIVFGYNSADLTETAKAQLRPVGEALASGKLQNLSFIVEGHTDAVGGDAYNRSLSQQRAASVKSFLVSNFNLNPSTIQIIGMGKSNLLDPSNPTSEVNRRVRIVTKK